MKVVAKLYLTGLIPNSSTASGTLFTSTEGGDYLVSIALANTSLGAATVQIDWTDALALNQSALVGSGGPSGGITVPANLPPGGVFTYTVGHGGLSTAPYNAYLTVVDLAAPGL